MSKFEVIRGVEGCSLALDDTRIAGPKPWGGGKIIHAWETDKTYMAVDVNSRWHDLFGTPERAARTLAKQCFGSDWEACAYCVNRDCDESLRKSGSFPFVKGELLEWLGGEDA